MTFGIPLRPNRPQYITLVTVYVQAHRCTAHCSAGNVFWRKHKGKTESTIKKPIFSSVFMIIRFVSWSMQYYNWQTNTQLHLHRHAHKHTRIRPRTRTHTHALSQTQNSNRLFLNVNNMSPAPPNLEERDRKGKGGKCQRPKRQASTSHNLLLYRSICIHLIAFCLCTFPNDSPYNSKTDQQPVTHRLTEMINCHDKLYLSPHVLPPLSWNAWAIVMCPYHVHDCGGAYLKSLHQPALISFLIIHSCFSWCWNGIICFLVQVLHVFSEFIESIKVAACIPDISHTAHWWRILLSGQNKNVWFFSLVIYDHISSLLP